MPEELTYREAGVDIGQAQLSLSGVADAIRATHDERVLDGLGSFGGVFDPQLAGMERPLLVSSIDGVGTKTRVAAMAGDFSGIGHDIVNHCVNDILCQGARPLFFLDYFGTSRLDSQVFGTVVQGAAEACRLVGCSLLGGETAEMPGSYHDDEIDIVGCIVGVVEAERRLPRGRIKPGDVIVGLASNGLHTNGFSLARRALFEVGGLSVRDEMPGLETTIGEELLRPHRCYFEVLHPLLESVPEIHAAAHITGGGLPGNLLRVIPGDTQAVLDRRSWTPLPIFQSIQEAGGIAGSEMYEVFNMGIGMALVVDKDMAAAVVQRLSQAGEMAAVIGELSHGTHDVQIP